MIHIDEAEKILSDYASSHGIQKAELCTLDENNIYDYVGRILAEDIYSPLDVPDFDNSAMDGYAVCVEDIDEAYPTLAVKGEIVAGDGIGELERGTCMRIFTGAPIPHGADAVIPQENCSIEKESHSITIHQLPQVRNHIRPKKQSFEKGEIVFQKGAEVSIELLTVVASLGITTLPLRKKLNVGICVTGAELQERGKPLEEGQIYESNGIFLQGILCAMQCNIVSKVHITDEKEKTKTTLMNLCEECDLVICTGGVSVGNRDFIKDVIHEHGSTLIRKVRIKPGKPFTFSEINKTPVFGLPGNPLSTYITFLWFVLPFIKKLQKSDHKNQDNRNTCCMVASPNDFSTNSRTQFIFVRLDIRNMQVLICKDQGSSALKNLVASNAALIVPADTEVKKGDTLQCWIFNHKVNM